MWEADKQLAIRTSDEGVESTLPAHYNRREAGNVSDTRV
jgi:hypothetical protein